MRRLTGKTITGEVQMVLVWKRLKEIEDILGEDYDLERLKQLLTGDNFTQEDMSAAYTSGYEIGRKQGPEGDTGAQGPRGVPERCDTCPAIFAVKVIAASDLQPVVRCKDCKHRGYTDRCPMRGVETVYYNEGEYPDGSECWDVYDEVTDRTVYDGFCNFGERRADDGSNH